MEAYLDAAEPRHQVFGFSLAQTRDGGESGEDWPERTLFGLLAWQPELVGVLFLLSGGQQLDQQLGQVFVQVVADGDQGQAQLDGAKHLQRHKVYKRGEGTYTEKVNFVVGQ